MSRTLSQSAAIASRLVLHRLFSRLDGGLKLAAGYRSFALSCLLLCLSASGQTAQAGAALFDWCLNLNGDTASACNSGTNNPNLPTNVNGSGFDFTLGTLSGPNNNRFGSISITLGPGSHQYVLAYMDYDLNFDTEGSNTDVGTVNGTAPAGVSYELDDPGTSNIFSDFASNALTNINNVGTPGTTSNPCCDVSWALGVGGLDVASDQTAIVTFTVGTSQPSGGFYLQQSNEYDGETIYLSETTTISSATSVPEPSTIAILGTGIIGLALLRRRGSRSRVAAQSQPRASWFGAGPASIRARQLKRSR